MKIVIRCGGAGTRLWPVSRKAKPKQFQPLLGSRNLFQLKLKEIQPLLKSWDDLYVSTVREYVPMVKHLAPRVHDHHIIAEPVRRNTGPGIALETALIAAQQSPGVDPVIVSLTVDDVMRKPSLFRELLRRAAQYIEHVDPFSIVTIGCPVRAPDTGFSYLLLGQTVRSGSRYSLRRVRRWVEKPGLGLLQRLLKRSNVVAHTGLYAWKASTVLSILESHHPSIYRRLTTIRSAYGTRQYSQVLKREFSRFPNASVEELVAHHAPNIITAVADLGWNDTGKWFLIQEILRKHPGANVVQGKVIALDTSDSLIYSPQGKVVTTIGLRDYIVVDTKDALLVCPKDRSGDVKKIVEELEQKGFHRYT